jgi:hypothetical protein
MAIIKPATFPGTIGTANEIKIRTMFDLEATVVRLTYQLMNSTDKQTIHTGYLVLPVEVYNGWGIDNQPIIEWAIAQLGLELETA